MSSTELHEFDLALRSDVQIAARVARVWACLENLQAWKPSVVSVDRVEGASGEIGEVLRVCQRGAHGVVYVRMRTLQSEPGLALAEQLEHSDLSRVRQRLEELGFQLVKRLAHLDRLSVDPPPQHERSQSNACEP